MDCFFDREGLESGRWSSEMVNGMLMERFVVFRHPLRYLLEVGRGWEFFSSLTLVFDFVLPHLPSFVFGEVGNFAVG
jgi:hypothetical protein